MATPTAKDMLIFWQQPSPRFRALVHVLLILMLSYSLAQLTWRLLPEPEHADLLPATGTLSKLTSVPDSSSLAQQIPQWHLFGKEIEEVVAPTPEELPETNLKLTLRGLIASSVPEEARAIVADPSGKENFYKIGDKLPGNAELDEIHADRIVIKRGGRFETLKLPKESLDIATLSSPPATAGRNSRYSGRHSSAAQPRNMSLGEYRDALLNDPRKVADLVRINPKFVSGKFVGYTLQPGRDASFLSRYGLRPGDVVTAVNGVTLDSPAKGFRLMKDLSSADTLNLVVDRNGVQQSFTLPVN